MSISDPINRPYSPPWTTSGSSPHCNVNAKDFRVVPGNQVPCVSDYEELLLYDQEDNQAILLDNIQHPTFDCNICMESHPEGDVARIDGCAHEFCRSCIRSHISSKLKDRLFPILCPSCSLRKLQQPNGEYPSIIIDG